MFKKTTKKKETRKLMRKMFFFCFSSLVRLFEQLFIKQQSFFIYLEMEFYLNYKSCFEHSVKSLI
jgi:hypothetical protein